jgi:dTMP kinase
MSCVDSASLAGALIAVEGTDGCGKSTTVRGLAERLGQQGLEVRIFDFPDHEDPLTGALVGRFLRGELGSLGTIQPEVAALIFAANRAGRVDDIRRAQSQGAVVLCDRYVYSNVAFQAAKLPDGERCEEFVEWVETLEFGRFRCPRPTISLWIRVPPAERPGADSAARGNRSYLRHSLDIHEQSDELQERVHEVYEELTRRRADLMAVDAMADGVFSTPGPLVERSMTCLRRAVAPL